MHAASKGKGAFLLKGSSKKKRSRQEIEEVKNEEEELKQDKQQVLRAYKQFKLGGGMPAERVAGDIRNEQILNNLFNMGVLDADGNYIGQMQN